MLAKARSGVLCLPNGYSNPERRQTAEMIVRISKGTFPLDRLSDAEHALAAGEAALRDALQQMPGLVRYYVAIDRDAGQLTNTSVWDSLEHRQRCRSSPRCSPNALFSNPQV